MNIKPEQMPNNEPKPIATTSSPNAAKPHVGGSCPMCGGIGWFFVNEWIGNLQGQKDCNCNKK